MRKIKFRVWDKKEKKMYTLVESYIISGMNLSAGSDCNLMQFTGLKDENGKEIYEGDVVKGILAYKTKVLGSVCFEEGMFIVKGNIIYPFPKKETRILLGGYNKSKYRDKIKVIGNIYENKELLNNDG